MKSAVVSFTIALALAGCGDDDVAAPVGVAPLDAQPPGSAPKHDARAFFENTRLAVAPGAGYAISADDSRLLISSDETGVFNVYAIGLADGRSTALTASSEQSTFAVSFFPDDDRILYRADTGGNERHHIYVRELDGTARDLTPGDEVRSLFTGWSPDGASFYVLANDRDPQLMDLYRVDATSYARELIYRNDEALSIADVSSDGRWLAAVKPNSSADSDIYLVDLDADARAPRLITEHEGDVAHGVYGITPDDAALIYSTDAGGEFVHAWRYDLGTGEKSHYLSADWDVSSVGFSLSGRYRVWRVNEDARSRVHMDDLDSGRAVDLAALPQGDIRGIRYGRDETQLALMLSSDTAPANIYRVDLTTGKAARLTDAANGEIDEADLVAAEVVRYPSFDGLEIPGILYRPHGASAAAPAPAVIWVHGGPGGQSVTGYNPVYQHLVNHGYVVLAANNRGSSGYGKTYFHMDDKRHGEVDLDDIVFGKTYLAGLPWVDGDRIGIIGRSYGGYMTVVALAFRPDEFALGIDIFGVMNWIRTLKSIPPWWRKNRARLYGELGDPYAEEERLRRISPLFHAKNITKPLLVVQGANDPRVLQIESDEIVQTVRNDGLDVEYIVFDDEGHGFTKRENLIKASDAYVKFLDKHLSLAAIDQSPSR